MNGLSFPCRQERVQRRKSREAEQGVSEPRSVCVCGVCNHAVLDSVGVKPQNCVKETSHLSQNPVSDLVKSSSKSSGSLLAKR